MLFGAFVLAWWITAGLAHAAEWELGAGVGALDVPAYAGADQRYRLAAPLPYLRYLGEHLRVRRNAVRWRLGGSARAWLDLSLGGGPPVHARGRRAGMPSIPWRVELGPRLNLRLVGDETEGGGLRVAWRRALDARGRDLGWLFVPELWWDAPHWLVRFGASYANKRFLRAYYGVPPRFARPGRPAFLLGSGWHELRASVLWRARHGKLRLWAGGVVYALAPFRVAASPLVASSLSFGWGAGIAWTWASSSTSPAAASAWR